MKIKNAYIFGGGTVAHIANHFAVTAPAYGNTAAKLYMMMTDDERWDSMNVELRLTKMAGGDYLETNEDIANEIAKLKADPNTKIIFFNCALVDYTPYRLQTETLEFFDSNENEFVNLDESYNAEELGKYKFRLDSSRNKNIDISFTKADKIIPTIRQGRKDIFLVGFKTTCGATKQEMYEKGLKLCKEGSVNLVLVNDTKTRFNMIVTPEEAAYHETDNREEELTVDDWIFITNVLYNNH
jgi:hypothetical protein